MTRSLVASAAVALIAVAGSLLLTAPDASGYPTPRTGPVVDCLMPGVSVQSLSSTARELCGVGSYSLSSTSALPDGGTAYSYVIEGSQTTYLVPSTGFDPQTASAAEDSLYGIDQAFLTAASSTPASSYSFDAPGPVIFSLPYSLDSTQGSDNSGDPDGATNQSWSGNEETDGGFTETDMSYREPGAAAPSCSNAAAVYWVGLGGDYGNTDLGQNGTAYSANGLSNGQGWTEVLPDQPTTVAQGFSTNPGDSLFVETMYDPNQFEYHFTFQDFTTGKGVFTFTNSKSINGATAEQIAERPLQNGLVPNLFDFAKLHVSAADARSVGNGPPRSIKTYTHQQITMQSAQNLTSETALTSDGGFDVSWLRCN